MINKKKFFIGTSGWDYKSWQNKFYPAKLKEEKLQFYSEYFDTVELNFSFYKLPTKKMFKNWRTLTPNNFKFSVKLSSYITHSKKLKIDTSGKRAIRNFLNNAAPLKNKFCIVLVQLPGNFKINIERLEQFINFFSNELIKKKSKARIALEFRHETWFYAETYEILRNYNCALVINDSAYFPYEETFTANFTYLRFHGPGMLYASKYSVNELKKWKPKINNFPKEIKEVYIYFNNDFFGYAIDDAKYLKNLFNQD